MDDHYKKILNFWFGYIDDKTPITLDSKMFKKWFSKNAAFDEEIRDKFESDLVKAKEGAYISWEQNPRGRLALVILFDQFTRNMYRDSPRAFENDHAALSLCLRSLTDGLDKQLLFLERKFLYMPLMHSEDIDIQEKSMECYAGLVEDAKTDGDVNLNHYEVTREFAKRHYDVIKQFGRFPHRNSILGRPSTEEETQFLSQPGSSF